MRLDTIHKSTNLFTTKEQPHAIFFNQNTHLCHDDKSLDRSKYFPYDKPLNINVDMQASIFLANMTSIATIFESRNTPTPPLYIHDMIRSTRI